ncbi:MAG: bifunctional nuclease family protein [Bacteroidales bacterium]|nr:bifunctional nuclease family protein [Bacteroidales bacterium]
MRKVEVHIKYIAEWNNATARMMVMETGDGKTAFPIIIARAEADCLLQELDAHAVRRPQPHDLMVSLMENFRIQLKEVYIYKVHEGIFYTQMQVASEERTEVIESRASDAVILALKRQCPVFVDSEVLEKVGVPFRFLSAMEDKGAEDGLQPEDAEGGEKSLETLERMLEEAVETENFELASTLRDEINARKSGQ